MSFIKKYRFHLILFLGLTVFYFLLRLYKLTDLPLFTDEAIYIRWAQIALDDASWRFISLTDGKQPLFIWVMMVFLNFITDPLLAGRLVSVLSGYGTLVGLWFVAYALFHKRRIAYSTALLYIAFPFAQVHDRLAIYDSLASFLYVWSFYFSILLVRNIRLDIAYTLGIFIGAGVLNKSTNFFSAYLLPFTLLLFNWKDKMWRPSLMRWIFFAAIAIVISIGMYSILRLSPLYSQVEVKTAMFVLSPSSELQKVKIYLDAGNYTELSKWFGDTLHRFGWNLYGLSGWLIDYLTFSYILLIAGSLIFIRKFMSEKLLLVIYFLLPFLSLAFFGIVLFPRFIFFMCVVLLPLAAWSLDYIFVYLTPRLKKNKIPVDNVYGLLLLLTIIYPLYISFQFALDPKNAPLAKSDSIQYVNNWTVGWGLNETISYLKNEANGKKIYVATQGTFGLLPAGLEMYLVHNKNITIKGFWPITDTLPEEILLNASKMPTYIIFYQPPQDKISTYPLELVLEEQAGKSPHYFRLYKVNAQ